MSVLTLRGEVLRTILPAYELLGRLAFVYLQGSLVSGYTETSDLDIVFVWDQPAVPERAAVVLALDEAQRDMPWIVDYEDVHIDRFVRAGQEYNTGHWTLSDLTAAANAVLAGGGLTPGPVLIPLIAISGFLYGDMLADPVGLGQQLRALLQPFPDALLAETSRIAQVRREQTMLDLQRSADRGDWLVFYSTLVGALPTVLMALFASHGIYYPGDKWMTAALARFGIHEAARTVYARLWEPGATPDDQVAALIALYDCALPALQGGH